MDTPNDLTPPASPALEQSARSGDPAPAPHPELPGVVYATVERDPCDGDGRPVA